MPGDGCAPDCRSAGFGKMAAMVRTHSYTIALPMVWPVLARRIASPTTAYMFSLAALLPAPSSASVFSSLICARNSSANSILGRHLMELPAP